MNHDFYALNKIACLESSTSSMCGQGCDGQPACRSWRVCGAGFKSSVIEARREIGLSLS